MSELTIAIADDDRLVLDLLQDFLDAQPRIKVLFTAESGAELISRLEADRVLPEIAIVDLKMQGMNGAEVTESLKLSFPSIRVVVISSHYKSSFMGFMVKAGVSAFLPKGVPPAQLTEILRTVHAHGYYFTDEQMGVIREQLSGKVPVPVTESSQALSDRETEVLKLICQQKTAKEIGGLLFISQSTVEGHKNNLFAKTGAKNIAGLVIYALQQQFVSPDELPVI